MSVLTTLTAHQRLALRTAYQDKLLRVDGQPSDAFILSCRNTVARPLVNKGLAVGGGKLGKADAVVLTVEGERLRAQLV